MMLIVGLLVCLVTSQDSAIWNFTPDGASGITDAWKWEETRTYELAASGSLELTWNLGNMEGTKLTGEQAGMTVSLGDHYEFEAVYQSESGGSPESLRIVGFADCDENCYWSSYECDFDKKTQKSTIVNGNTAQTIKVKVTITGNETDHCEWLADVVEGWASWVKMVLIITIVTLVLCVLCAILVCCGVVKCCCAQQQNAVVVETAKY